MAEWSRKEYHVETCMHNTQACLELMLYVAPCRPIELDKFIDF